MGYAEVGQFYSPGICQDDICRFDVTVNNSLSVCVTKGIEKLHHDTDDVIRAEVSTSGKIFAEVVPFDVLHYNVGNITFITIFVNRNDTRMGQASSCPGLMFESGQDIFHIAGYLILADCLDCYRTEDVL